MGSKHQTVFEVCVSLAKALRSAREQFEALETSYGDDLNLPKDLAEELRSNMQDTEENLLDFATHVLEDSEFEFPDLSKSKKFDVN